MSEYKIERYNDIAIELAKFAPIFAKGDDHDAELEAAKTIRELRQIIERLRRIVDDGEPNEDAEDARIYRMVDVWKLPKDVLVKVVWEFLQWYGDYETGCPAKVCKDYPCYFKKEQKQELDENLANGDLDKREAAIKKIAGGKPYKAIFDAVYPRSRFAEAIVTFKNKGYNKDDFMALYKQDPASLSADEYVLLIKDGAPKEVVNSAVELYPNDARVAAVAAERFYNDGDVDKAIELYKKAGNTEEVYNNLACCYLCKSDFDNAKACLEKAENLKVAETNANELRKVYLNNKFFGK